MSNYIIQDTTLADIANAIRSKTGSTGLMTPLEMPNEIESIGTGGGGLPPDTPWVRPSNYPDLDSLVLDNTANEIYFTVDKTLDTSVTQLIFSNYQSALGKERISIGHIENRIFVEDVYSSTGRFTLADIEEDVFLVKIQTNAGSGPARVTSMLGETVSEGFKVSFNAGLCSTLELVALISISLGIMNLLPIPVLDGGLILFALIAILVRKEVPPKIQYKIQIIGSIFIVFIFLIGTTGDVKYFINKMNVR